MLADPVFVSIDADKYSQALTHVVGNAYKYSPNGGSIELDLVRDAKGNAGIRVSDHGLGMTPKQLARAFERFFRADTSGNGPRPVAGEGDHGDPWRSRGDHKRIRPRNAGDAMAAGGGPWRRSAGRLTGRAVPDANAPRTGRSTGRGGGALGSARRRE